MAGRPILCVVPVAVDDEADVDRLLRCLVSLAGSAPGAELLLVDHGTTPQRAAALAAASRELGAVHEAPGTAHRVAALNHGLRRALESGRDAVAVAPDALFVLGDWLEPLQAAAGRDGAPAAVAGARVLYANGLLCHAGYAFSFLRRTWLDRFHLGPGDLPEALAPFRCPTSSALQLIRHETLAAVGVYDERYPGGLEDVDLCLRAFAAGLECTYVPAAACARDTPMRWAMDDRNLPDDVRASRERLVEVWHHLDHAPWVPRFL